MQLARNVLISIVRQHLNGITAKDLHVRYRQELNGFAPISRSAMISLIANEISDAIKCFKQGHRLFYKPLDTKKSTNTSSLFNQSQYHVAALSFPPCIESDSNCGPESREAWTRLRYERETEIYSLEFPQTVAEILKPNATEVVRVSQINAPSKFWIHLRNYGFALKKLQRDIR